MKRIIQGLVLATLISTAQASPFPADGEPVAVDAQSTYADRHADKGNATGSSFPADGEPVALDAQSTYADRHADKGIAMGSSFPADGEPVALAAQSTYADRYAMGRAPTQAALSE